MRRNARTDSNHAEVRERYRLLGWHVVDTSGVGGGFPDLVAVKGGRLELVEVKRPKLSPSKRLKPAQVKLHALFAECGVPVRIVTDVEQVTS